MVREFGVTEDWIYSVVRKHRRQRRTDQLGLFDPAE
ncbi:hypothetical protein [Pseudomonas aeruginosa]